MAEQNEETIYLHLAKKIAAITPTTWDYDFDPDEIFRIDPFNIFGEIITMPVLVNRLGILVSEMTRYVKEQKTWIAIKEADLRRICRKKEVSEGRKKPSIAEVDDLVLLDPVIKAMKFKFIKHEEELSKLEMMYESARDKSFKLNNLSKHLKPEEFEKEIMETTINGVMIKLRDKIV